MIYPLNLMLPVLEEKGIKYTDETLEKLDKYAALLVEWNEKINLTAITDPEGIVIKHFCCGQIMM